MRNKDTEFEILMRLATKECLDEEVAEFNAIDTSDITISKKTTRKVMRAIWLASIRDSQGMIVLKKVVVASMLICTILFTSMMCIRPVRAAFWNAIVTWYENHIGIVFVQEDTVEYPEFIEETVLPDLPDGWTLSVIYEGQSGGTYLISSADENQILYYQMPVPDNELWYDNTECTIAEVTLENDLEAYLCVYKDGRMILTWVSKYVFVLQGESVASDVLIRIAESIHP